MQQRASCVTRGAVSGLAVVIVQEQLASTLAHCCIRSNHGARGDVAQSSSTVPHCQRDVDLQNHFDLLAATSFASSQDAFPAARLFVQQPAKSGQVEPFWSACGNQDVFPAASQDQTGVIKGIKTSMGMQALPRESAARMCP